MSCLCVCVQFLDEKKMLKNVSEISGQVTSVNNLRLFDNTVLMARFSHLNSFMMQTNRKPGIWANQSWNN